ncbi:MAG TPA: GNAT family N-acetyltransferase [Solirubrobacteraceae bacterium]
MSALAPPDLPLADGVVTLRAWRADDLDAVVEALQDPTITRWTRVPSPYGPRQFAAWMAEQGEQRTAGTGLHFLVVDSRQRVVGAVGVQLTEDAPDIGYWCAAKHRGRGYTSRAVRLLRDHLRALGFSRVDIFIHHDNELSQHVAEAANFARQPGLTKVERLGDEAVYVRFTFP